MTNPESPTTFINHKGRLVHKAKDHHDASNKSSSTTLAQPLVMVDQQEGVKLVEKSMWRKWKDGGITRTEYNDYMARQNGFNDANDAINHWIADKGMTRSEYNDYKACKEGYKNHSDRCMQWRYKRGMNKSTIDNKECANYLGIHIAERLLSKIFENVTRMPYGNPSYDFICKKGYKIDVKSSCIRKNRNNWSFGIDKNQIADYFLLLAFDNRKDLNPLHIWLIKGNEMLGNGNMVKKPLNVRNTLTIFNTEKNIGLYKKYEQIDKLEKLKECCGEL